MNHRPVTFPAPVPDEVSAFFWEGVALSELRIQRCSDCGRFQHYPRRICRECLSTRLHWQVVSGDARLYSWTQSLTAIDPFFADRVPYVLCSVELAEQRDLMFLSQIIDCPEGQLRAGMPLSVVFCQMAPGWKMPLFRRIQED
jgi:uncharacterized OB-fold protein